MVSSLWAVDDAGHSMGRPAEQSCVVRPTSAEFGLHPGSTDFNTQNKEWIRVYIIISKILLCIFLYIMQ